MTDDTGRRGRQARRMTYWTTSMTTAWQTDQVNSIHSIPIEIYRGCKCKVTIALSRLCDLQWCRVSWVSVPCDYCNWLVNRTTTAWRFQVILLPLEIRVIDIQVGFELSGYFRPIFIPESTETVWSPRARRSHRAYSWLQGWACGERERRRGRGMKEGRREEGRKE